MAVPVGRAGTDVRPVDEAVAALHREHYRSLVRLGSLLLDDVGASEEVVQDAFVSLYQRWGRLRQPEQAAAYLRSAVLNGARSRLRHRQVRERRPLAAVGSTEAADGGALAGDEHRAMVEALRTLPARQREVLVLRYYLDLSEAEIAETLGMATGTVKTHAHRGLAALQQQFEEDDR